MAYTPETVLPTISEMAWFQWSRPDAENPGLAAPVSATATTLKFKYAPLDHEGNVITKAFLMGCRNEASYVESILVPVGALSGDGKTATGVVRGVRLEGLDWTTGDEDLAVQHKSGDSVFCQISGVTQMLNNAALNGEIATGGAGLTIGTDAVGTTTLYRSTGVGTKAGFLRWEVGGKTQYSNDGTIWNNVDDVTAGSLVVVSGADTTPGNLETKAQAGANMTITKKNAGGNEYLEFEADSKNETVVEHETYTPAYLTGGSSAEGTFSNWLAVLDGEFSIDIDGVNYDIAGIDFTGVTDMNDVASYIETAIQTATGSTETCVWSVDHFIISSVDTTSSSAITVTSTVAAPVGTDISGAGASDWMDCDTGNGAVTEALLDPSADAGKVVELDTDGRVGETIIPYKEKTYLDLRWGIDTLKDDVTEADAFMYPYNEGALHDSIVDAGLLELSPNAGQTLILEDGESYTRVVAEPFNIFKSVNDIETSVYKLGALTAGSEVTIDNNGGNTATAIQKNKLLVGGTSDLVLYEIAEDGTQTLLDSATVGSNIYSVSATSVDNVWMVLYWSGTQTTVLFFSTFNNEIDLTYDTAHAIYTSEWNRTGEAVMYGDETILIPMMNSSSTTSNTAYMRKVIYDPVSGKRVSTTTATFTIAVSGNIAQSELVILDDDVVLQVVGMRYSSTGAATMEAAIYTPSTNTFGASNVLTSSNEYKCTAWKSSTTTAELVGINIGGTITHYPLTISGATVTLGAGTVLDTSSDPEDLVIQRLTNTEALFAYTSSSGVIKTAYLDTSGTPTLSGSITFVSGKTSALEPGSIALYYGPYFYIAYEDSNYAYFKPLTATKDVTGTASIGIDVNGDTVASVDYGLATTTTIDQEVVADNKIDLEIINNSGETVVVDLDGVDCDVY